MSMLEVRNVSKTFDDLEVLKDISFNVEKGEVVAIIGPSGSGKSTLLRCINQLEHADSGIIKVCGTDMLVKNSSGKTVYADKKTLREIRLKTGLVFQNFNLFPHFTVKRNITEAPVCVLKKDKAEASKKADELLKKMGLETKGESYPCELSGGQQQRVSIARALVKNPKMILADEPTAALDFQTGQEVLRVIERIVKEKGTTVIMITHNVEIAKMAHRVVKLRNGQISGIKTNLSPLSADEISW